MVRAGYKLTEIGEIPNDWKVARFPDVAWYQEGPGLRKWQFTKKGLKIINVTNLQKSGFLNLDKTDRHISWLEFEKIYKHFLIDEHDFVMASSGNSYCKSSVVRQCDLPLLMNTSVIRFKPKKNMTAKYMQSYMKSKFFKDQIDLLITGGAQPNFGPVHLDKILIPTPPNKVEQKNIAKALSESDELIVSLEKLIAKKRDIKTGAMQQLLTGKKRLPGFGDGKGTKHTELGKIPEDWDVKRLGNIVNFINGRAYSIHEWEKQGIPVIRLQNLTKRGGKYYFSNLKLPDKQYCNNGDLLYMWSATFGPVIWFGDKAIFHYHIWKVECFPETDKKFLYYLLDEMTENLKRGSSSGGTMLHVTKEKMENTQISTPSFEEQVEIGTVLSCIDDDIAATQEELNKTKAIKQGMMQELLTGRTRLI